MYTSAHVYTDGPTFVECTAYQRRWRPLAGAVAAAAAWHSDPAWLARTASPAASSSVWPESSSKEQKTIALWLRQQGFKFVNIVL